ncbi:MAG: hypothetical protein JWR80_6145 [Bradyrhizobium sp.]|nr:hypothetical protein [Bradyrhizobium sp.]
MIRPMETEGDLLSRSAVIAASIDGIAVEVTGRSEVRPWDSITSVGATLVHHGEAKIFVLAISFDDVRTIVIDETNIAWPHMVELLHTCLPGVEPFTSWAPKLLAKPGVIELFDREG